MATRTSRPQVWLATLTLSVGMLTISHNTVLHGRGADAKRTSGIYLEAADTGGKDELKRLTGQMAQSMPEGIGASMATMGFKKPKLVTKLGGEKSALRLPAQSSFLFVFGADRNAAMPAPGADPMEAMAKMGDSMSQLSPNTSSPKDYMLIMFTVADGGRVYNTGSPHQVKCTVTNVDKITFRVKPTSPLEPGEYAFTYAANGGGGVIWEFGVDGAATQ
jgi:hypothetical protein